MSSAAAGTGASGGGNAATKRVVAHVHTVPTALELGTIPGEHSAFASPSASLRKALTASRANLQPEQLKAVLATLARANPAHDHSTNVQAFA